jgi:CheY-like chemotaxis protein
MRILVALGAPGAAESLGRLLVEIGWPAPSIASNSTEALEWIEASGGCDILIADTHLTPMDGFTLRDEIRSRLPALRAILTSPPGVSPPLEHLGNDPFLPTPFTPAILADCLHQLLSDKPVAAPLQPEEPADTPLPPPRETLIGSTLGNYRIEAIVGEYPWEILYHANQTNVGRNVILHVLKPEFSSDPAAVTAFQHRASLKAALDHPKVASVYEGGEWRGVHYFSMEDISLPSLAARMHSGKTLPGLGAMEILALVAEIQKQLAASGAGSDSIDAEDIFFKRGKPPRLANIAAPLVEPATPPSIEIARLASILIACIDPSPASEPARIILQRAANATTDPLDW